MGNTIKLELSLDEVNTILSALAELPFKMSYQLVPKIQKMAQDSIEPTKTAE